MLGRLRYSRRRFSLFQGGVKDDMNDYSQTKEPDPAD
jgi:hypothetical protein